MKKITPKHIKKLLIFVIGLILITTYFQDKILKFPLIVKYLNKIDILTTIFNWLIILFLYEEYVGSENKVKRLEEKKKKNFERKVETLLKLEDELVTKSDKSDKRYLRVQIKRFSMLVEKLEKISKEACSSENYPHKEYLVKVDSLSDLFKDLLVEDGLDQAKLLQNVYLIQDEITSEEFEEYNNIELV